MTQSDESLKILNEAEAKEDRRQNGIITGWTAKVKKHAIYTTEVDGVKKSMPVTVHLKQLALSLPPMQRGKRRIVHFEELKRKFMSGSTREASMRLVNAYCMEMVDIYNKAVEEHKQKQSDEII